ncbi:related to cAMP-independent regulatory protein pac2 [Melanopsichium pennsylvanicum]|uniref:Related to cAMP-independent regulatory protein pac2 n=2 Tax=Melanopsichium pennsylvanicum TaxID=63383 RepID=A0AAJ4XLM2_9BASI|nr:related to cAMP-independent regulatory protein pac2 [Melanopsichium pennsylvanicum 4]SNX84408.1 related to cAMP-independent regulatory protein pac2 [Melanopsichium pennsylvanicum]
MPGPYSNSSYPHDRYSHHAEEHTNTMHSYNNRHMPIRPDFARSQTLPRGALPGPPHGPMYPDHGQHERAYPPHHAPHPTYTRQHRSYYDERGPLPPPPLHHRHTHHEDPYYGYDGRSPNSSSPVQPLGPYNYAYHAPPQHSVHAAHHDRHPQYHHHASFSSSDSFASSSLHGMRGPVGNPMSMPTGSQQLPTYRGHIKTTKDAILLLAACDLVEDTDSPGLPPPRRVTRRLLDSERADLICSGSIFVWDEKEAGMRRWTDGKCWSASRVSGCFLTYRELEARKKPSSSITGGPTSNLYKAEGLIKQSFSMTTTSGRKLHVISYYTKRDVREGLLRRVSEDPRFVGENGGEWGLEVDEAEYPDPISRAGDLPPGVNPDELEGSQSPSGPAHAEVPREEAMQRSRDNSYHGACKITPGPRGLGDGLRTSPHHSPPRRGLDGHHLAYGPAAVKGELMDRLPYPAEVTPLHEARGLLPIRPIHVDSKMSPADFSVGRNDAAPTPLSPGHLYGRKRSCQDFRSSSIDDHNDVKPQRPKLQRLRSSSMSIRNSSAQDVLAPIRALGRVGSDDEGVSKLRSTHGVVGFGKEQHDSAVGALLSLRSGSGSSDDSGVAPTTAPSSTEEEVTPAKGSFSRMDRAALDRFPVRI